MLNLIWPCGTDEWHMEGMWAGSGPWILHVLSSTGGPHLGWSRTMCQASATGDAAQEGPGPSKPCRQYMFWALYVWSGAAKGAALGAGLWDSMSHMFDALCFVLCSEIFLLPLLLWLALQQETNTFWSNFFKIVIILCTFILNVRCALTFLFGQPAFPSPFNNLLAVTYTS